MPARRRLPRDGVLSAGGGCEQLGIKPADFMLNKPAWLGDAPVVSDIADTEDCDVLVIGAGNAGTVAALRCQEEGANVFLADMQTYDEYDEYACDMACYNSKLFLDKGTPEIDTTEVFNEYMRLSRGHAHQKIVRDYAMRSGEMLDWMVGHIPAEYVEKYAKTSNYKGNDNFNGECCGQRSWPAMTQWRDEESNINMWPFVIRSVHAAFEEAGGTIKWGYQGVVLVQDGDAVTGAVFQDVDGAYHQINAKAVVVAAGDFGGNPDMRLDLSDQMRNLAWSYGNDRTDATSIGGMGRDGSGIRMCMWAGGTMEGGPRAGQAAGINGVPGFAFGGAWPCFGNDGKRFMNEDVPGQNIAAEHTRQPVAKDPELAKAGVKAWQIFDSKWKDQIKYMDTGHGNVNWYVESGSDVPNGSYGKNAYISDEDNEDGNTPGFLSYFEGEKALGVTANSIAELAKLMEVDEAALTATIERYNELAAAGNDEDFGKRADRLFPVEEGPFYAYPLTDTVILVNMGGLQTDVDFNVMDTEDEVIEGLYAVGNAQGGRFLVDYPLPAPGISHGMALTHGMLVGRILAQL